MAKVGSTLTRLLTEHQRLRVNQSEGVDHNLALDRLDRIDDDGDRPRSQLLERLLRVDINRGQPAPETGMGVVPADDGFRSGWNR